MNKRNDKAALLQLGKAQVEAMFTHQEDTSAIDDSEFIPLLESVLTSFESYGLAETDADELWDYAYHVYDRLCREAAPEFSFEENRDMMRSHLLGPRRLATHR